MDPGESCDLPRAVLANTTTHHIAETATLEGMPTEIHWQILRDFLKHPETIELFPQDSYDNRSWGFGSLGILSVSKYFSTIELIVLYGENDFSISKSDCSLKDFDGSMNPVDEREPVSSPIIIFGRILES